jgi:glycosyltransferase involved in cell wall biosynthesis
MTLHLLLVGGEDHRLRMPFMTALRSIGHKITVAASGDPDPFLRAGFAFQPFQFNRFCGPRSDFRARRVLAKMLRDVDADVAHCFDTKLGLLVPFAASANPRTAIVRTINGRGWIFSSRSPPALALRAAYLPLQRLASSFTDATVFEHSGDQSCFARYRRVGARRSGPSPQDLRRELGLVGAEVVTTVTRVTRQKGIPALLRAADLVHRVRPSVRFLVVGPRESEGPFGVSDREMQQRSPYVLATGPRADVPSILAMSDLFAFPSEYAEGVPRALMEAALCGLPIVTTNLAGCREVVRAGWNGAVTPLRDPRSLAETIIDLLSHPSKSMAMAVRGPDVIRSKFSLNNVVERHAELYEGLVRKQGFSQASKPPHSDEHGLADGSLLWRQPHEGVRADGPRKGGQSPW